MPSNLQRSFYAKTPRRLKNEVKTYFLIGIVVILLTLGLSMGGCSSNGSSSGSNTMTTLEIQNRSSYANETIM